MTVCNLTVFGTRVNSRQNALARSGSHGSTPFTGDAAVSILAGRHMKLLQKFAEICRTFAETSHRSFFTGPLSQVSLTGVITGFLSQGRITGPLSQVLSHRSSLTGPLSQLNRYRHPYVRDVLHVISHRSSLTGLFHRYSFIGPSLIGLFHRFLSQGASSQVSLTGRVS